MTIEENENYIVEAVTNALEPVEMSGSRYNSYYEVTNKHTNIVELRTPVLPEALHQAAHANAALRTKPWEWIDRDLDEEAAGEIH